jgi:hypothetical protein
MPSMKAALPEESGKLNNNRLKKKLLIAPYELIVVGKKIMVVFMHKNKLNSLYDVY